MSTERVSILLAGVVGFLGVALGAFGAHGLKRRVEPLPDGAQRMAWWQTGAQYHLVHALAIGLCAVRPSAAQTPSAVAPWLFLAGIVLFSGSLYGMTLTGARKLGAVTPIGGTLFLVGWASLAWSAFRIVD